VKRTIGAVVLVLSVPAGTFAALCESSDLWVLCVALLVGGLVLTKDDPCPRCGSDRCLRSGRCGR